MSNTATPLPSTQADLVICNATLYTVDPAQPTAEAMAIAGDRILMVGSTAEVRGAFPTAPRLDADGRTVVPGFIDAHAHLLYLGMNRLQANLVGAQDIAEVVARLKSVEASLPGGGWLLGNGWNHNDWPGKAWPSRADLDAAFPTRPVLLLQGHAGWANTAALEQIGLGALRALPDPEGGVIDRDDAGEPTGIFVDSALALVVEKVPFPATETLEKALQVAIAEANKLGLTGIHDPGLFIYPWFLRDRTTGVQTVELFKRAIDRDQFNIRVYGMALATDALFDVLCESGPITEYGGKLTVGAAKLFIDGALSSRGAALLEAYADDPGNMGLLTQTPFGIDTGRFSSFEAYVEHALAHGLQVSTHAIGDAGTRAVLDVYERVMSRHERHAGRHRIEHAQVVASEDIPRFARLGVIASMQPIHATSDMGWVEERLGSRRVERTYAWRSLLDAGARLAFGSDAPIEPISPLAGFHAAVTRQDAQGLPEGGWRPEQRLSRAEALRAYTLDAAYAAFQESTRGSLAKGKYADFVILSHDIMTVPDQALLETQVVATYLGGQCVYSGESVHA